MFDEKYIEQYRTITASQSLKARVMEQENKPHKIISFPRKALSVAACIAIVIVSLFALGNGGTRVSISSAPVAVSRSTDTCVMLDIDVRSEAVVTVSGGTLKTENSDEMSDKVGIDGSAQLKWFVDYDKTYTVTVEDGKRTKQYSLGFNEHSQMWEFEKIN